MPVIKILPGDVSCPWYHGAYGGQFEKWPPMDTFHYFQIIGDIISILTQLTKTIEIKSFEDNGNGIQGNYSTNMLVMKLLQ